MKFSHKNDYGNELEYTVPEGADLNDVLDSFIDFLRGCGYTIPYENYLTIVSGKEQNSPAHESVNRKDDDDDDVEHWGQDVDFD
jgi:hypothetical protein